MSKIDEFQEIAHCGGKITFHIHTEGGKLSYSIEFSHSRPTPAAVFAVYALPEGIPVEDIQLGGIGQQWNPPPVSHAFPVFIASDEQGFFGHKCRAGCNGYWRSKSAPSRWPLTCPYCGHRGKTYMFLTDAHLKYVQHYTLTLVSALETVTENKDIVIDMDSVLEKAGDIPKPEFYYAETSQQERYKCEACKVENDILGHFGYCGCCGTRNNLQLLRADLTEIKEALQKGVQPSECVKQIISNLDAFGRDYVSQLCLKVPMTKKRQNAAKNIRFHNLEKTAEGLQRVFDIDLLNGLDKPTIEFAALMFFRRHIYEHRAGVADEQYLADSGDTSVQRGQAIRESSDNVHRLLELALILAENLHSGFHEILPAVQKALRR